MVIELSSPFKEDLFAEKLDIEKFSDDPLWFLFHQRVETIVQSPVLQKDSRKRQRSLPVLKHYFKTPAAIIEE